MENYDLSERSRWNAQRGLCQDTRKVFIEQISLSSDESEWCLPLIIRLYLSLLIIRHTSLLIIRHTSLLIIRHTSLKTYDHVLREAGAIFDFYCQFIIAQFPRRYATCRRAQLVSNNDCKHARCRRFFCAGSQPRIPPKLKTPQI